MRYNARMDATIPWSFALAAAITAGAGIVRGFAGFGSSMLLAPALSALYTPAVAVPMLGVMELGVSGQLLPRAVFIAKWRTVAILAAAAAGGVPFGAHVLQVVPADAMRWTMSAAILTALGLIVLGAGRRGEARWPGTLLTGGLSGFSAGATGMGGPPIVLYYLAGRDPAAEIRASLICFFLLTSVMQLAAYAVNGLLTVANGLQGLMLLPVFIAGAVAGSRLFDGARERLYRRVALALVAMVAVGSLVY